MENKKKLFESLRRKFSTTQKFQKIKNLQSQYIKVLNIEFSNDWNFCIVDFEILQFLVYEISKMSKFIL